MATVRKTRYYCPVCDQPVYTKDGEYYFCADSSHTKAVHRNSLAAFNMRTVSREQIAEAVQRAEAVARVISELPICGSECVINGKRIYWVEGSGDRYSYVCKGLKEDDESCVSAIHATRKIVISLKKMTTSEVNRVIDSIIIRRKNRKRKNVNSNQ